MEGVQPMLKLHIDHLDSKHESSTSSPAGIDAIAAAFCDICLNL
jgi:hypothetical protein